MADQDKLQWALDTLDDAHSGCANQSDLRDAMSILKLALLREGFEAGFHARPTPTQTSWDFVPQGVNMVSNAKHAFQAFLTQRQHEKETR